MAAIEAKQSLSIESFSYSWLVNLKPSLESLEGSFRASIDAYDEASFIEMDPKLPPSKRFFRAPQDLSFDFPVSHSPLEEVHADELIYNGYLMPLVFKQLKMQPGDNSDSMLATPSSFSDHKGAHTKSRVRCTSLRMCRRLSKRILEKYLNFVWPFCQKIVGRRGENVRRAKFRRQDTKIWEGSPLTSPRTSLANSVDNWRSSCDSESSIYEAVLHCKRTIVQVTKRGSFSQKMTMEIKRRMQKKMRDLEKDHQPLSHYPFLFRDVIANLSCSGSRCCNFSQIN